MHDVDKAKCHIKLRALHDTEIFFMRESDLNFKFLVFLRFDLDYDMEVYGM